MPFFKYNKVLFVYFLQLSKLFLFNDYEYLKYIEIEFYAIFIKIKSKFIMSSNASKLLMENTIVTVATNASVYMQ